MRINKKIVTSLLKPTVASLMSVGLLLACSSTEGKSEGSDGGSVADASTSADGGMEEIVAKWASIAKAKGCATPDHSTLTVPARCMQQYLDWLSCIERDLDQCICEETNNSLNCEGSYKSDEGPAKCVTEAAVRKCE